MTGVCRRPRRMAARRDVRLESLHPSQGRQLDGGRRNLGRAVGSRALLILLATFGDAEEDSELPAGGRRPGANGRPIRTSRSSPLGPAFGSRRPASPATSGFVPSASRTSASASSGPSTTRRADQPRSHSGGGLVSATLHPATPWALTRDNGSSDSALSTTRCGATPPSPHRIAFPFHRSAERSPPSRPRDAVSPGHGPGSDPGHDS